MTRFVSVGTAVDELRKGNLVIVVDAEDRENEGDLVTAARSVTAEKINFMISHGRGLVCAPATKERLDRLQLDLMVRDGNSIHGTAFTVSVDAVTGTTTGISAPDRARTLRVLADPASRPSDLARPGHVFPLCAHPGGLKARAGHTEAVVELVRLAGVGEVGVLCEVLNGDGTMSRIPDLARMAERFDLRLITIEDMIEELH